MRRNVSNTRGPRKPVVSWSKTRTSRMSPPPSEREQIQEILTTFEMISDFFSTRFCDMVDQLVERHCAVDKRPKGPGYVVPLSKTKLPRDTTTTRQSSRVHSVVSSTVTRSHPTDIRYPSTSSRQHPSIMTKQPSNATITRQSSADSQQLSECRHPNSDASRRVAIKAVLRTSRYHTKSFWRYTEEPVNNIPISSAREMMDTVIDGLLTLYHGTSTKERNAQLLLQIFNARRLPNHIFYMRFVCPAIILIGMPSFTFSCSNPCGRNTANCRILTEALAHAAGIGKPANTTCSTPCKMGCDLLTQLMNRYVTSTECPIGEQEVKDVNRFLRIFNNVLEIATRRTCRITPTPSGGPRPVETKQPVIQRELSKMNYMQQHTKTLRQNSS